MIDKNLYRYAEQALRDYPADYARLQWLNEYLASPIGPDYAGPVQGGESTPEQELFLYRQCRSEEYQALTAKVRPLFHFLGAISSMEYKLVELRYFQGKSWSQVADALHASAETCRRWWGPRVIRKAVKVLLGF